MNKPKTTHTSFYKGSKIRIIFRYDRKPIIAKYKETLGNRAIRTDVGDFLIKDIRCVNYYKPLQHEINKNERNNYLFGN